MALNIKAKIPTGLNPLPVIAAIYFPDSIRQHRDRQVFAAAKSLARNPAPQFSHTLSHALLHALWGKRSAVANKAVAQLDPSPYRSRYCEVEDGLKASSGMRHIGPYARPGTGLKEQGVIVRFFDVVRAWALKSDKDSKMQIATRPLRRQAAAVPGPFLLPRFLITLTLAISVWLGPAPALGSELPMKPEPNYSIWLNINEAVIAVARITAGNEKWVAELAEMHPGNFSGKEPRDVLIEVVAFSRQINHLRQGFDDELSPIHLSADYDAIDPGTVYRSSGRILAAMAEYLICVGGNDLMIARFFQRRRFPDIAPSDVFSIVDLASRRLDNLMMQAVPEGLTTSECR